MTELALLFAGLFLFVPAAMCWTWLLASLWAWFRGPRETVEQINADCVADAYRAMIERKPRAEVVPFRRDPTRAA